MTQTEACSSGLRGLVANQVDPQGSRGFESHRFLHEKVIGDAMMHAAEVIALSSAQLAIKLFPCHGPDNAAYAAIASVLGAALTSPITLPLFLTGVHLSG